MIGEAGLTESVMKEVAASLDAHGLIKVRVFGDDREARVAMYDQIANDLDAGQVQHIGKLLVLYRPKKETVKERSGKSGPGMREVTIVKASASGTKKPSVTKVMLKGNERVTAGGNIKRAKPRQTSSKKNSLNK